MKWVYIFLCCILYAGVQPGTADARRAHKAHAHGSAHIKLIITKGAISGTLTLAAEDAVGFEHKPKTQSEKEKIENTNIYLQNIKQWMHINMTAKCTYDTGQFAYAYSGNHAEILLDFNGNCETPGAIETIEFKLHEQFPSLHDIEVISLRDGAAKIDILNSKNRRVQF